MKKLLLTCGLLAGCADYGVAVNNQLAIGDVCSRIATARGPNGNPAAVQAGIAELRPTAQFSESDLSQIAAGLIVTGMSEKAGVCVLGGTGIAADAVTTTAANGHVMKTFTFSGGGNAPPIYLYTDNGIVTGTR
jgi:hypothetical protein